MSRMRMRGRSGDNILNRRILSDRLQRSRLDCKAPRKIAVASQRLDCNPLAFLRVGANPLACN
eukprot:4019148-Pyramimonas_sp.AAC.1